MSRWPVVALGEVAPLVRRPVTIDEKADYPELGVRSFGRGTFHKPSLPGIEVGSKRLFRIETGDLLFNIVFAWEGAVAIATSSDHGRVGSHRFLTCVTEPMTASFLRYFFLTAEGLRLLGQASPGGAGRNRTLGLNQLNAIPVPFPPRDVQRRIVTKLDAVAERVAARSASLVAIEAELTTTLRVAFDQIIAGAPRRPMGEIAPLVRRPVAIEIETEYTEIGIKSFNKGIFHRRRMRGAEYSWQKLFYLRHGDLIFSNLMAWERAIAVAGEIDDRCGCNHRMLTCEANQIFCVASFLNFYFKNPEGFAEIILASPGSIARNKTLSPILLSKISVPLPSLDAQHWFDSVQDKAASIRARHAAASSNLNTLLPALLAEAFGERSPSTTPAR